MFVAFSATGRPCELFKEKNNNLKKPDQSLALTLNYSQLCLY
jgi:hypothetical protein